MRRASILAALAACVPDSTPEWQLDHDRIVAVRAEPPAIPPGGVATLEILHAHAGGPTTVEKAEQMSAVDSSLFLAVHYNIDHWEIDGPDETQLAAARSELGLAADAPVPLDVELTVSGPLYATKRVLLGIAADNPALPAVSIDGTAPATTIDVGRDRNAALLIEATTAHWFTSCGELRGDREPSATLVTSAACDGELAVVVHEGEAGVAWAVWPLHVR